MKNRVSASKIIAYGLIITIIALGYYFAEMTIYKNEVVVNGILSMALMYFLVKNFVIKRIKTDDPIEPVESVLKFPNYITYPIPLFILAVITVWTIERIRQTIVFFLP